MPSNNNRPLSLVVNYTYSEVSENVVRSVPEKNSPEAKTIDYLKFDENHKLVRRYSFDDNGGGYLGL